MRCDAVRQIVEEGMDRPPAVAAHLESCSGCKEYVRKWETLRAALIALRSEDAPEPSIGFTTRVMRRLEDTPADPSQQFIDQIGRRVVYATLMVALMLLLVLLLPSSGPYRSSGISQSVLVQPQVAMLSNEQILGVDGMDNSDQADSSPSPAATDTSGGAGK